MTLEKAAGDRVEVRSENLQASNDAEAGTADGASDAGTAAASNLEDKRLRWQKYQVFVTGASCCVAIVALICVAIQAWIATKNSKTSAAALSSSEKTAQMVYNLQIMARLDDMLSDTAKDSDCYDYVWRKQPIYPEHDSKQIQCGDSIVDALSLALKAVNSLPCFSVNGEDWASYARYLMSHSDNLKHRVLATVNEEDKNDAGWWPEVLPYAQNVNYIPPIPAGSDDCN